MHDETHWLTPKEPDGSLSSDNFLQHMVHSCIAALSFSATRAMCDDCSNPKSGSTRKYWYISKLSNMISLWSNSFKLYQIIYTIVIYTYVHICILYTVILYIMYNLCIISTHFNNDACPLIKLTHQLRRTSNRHGLRNSTFAVSSPVVQNGEGKPFNERTCGKDSARAAVFCWLGGPQPLGCVRRCESRYDWRARNRV